jgi:hypothetical protein
VTDGLVANGYSAGDCLRLTLRQIDLFSEIVKERNERVKRAMRR